MSTTQEATPYQDGVTQIDSFEEISEILRSPKFEQGAFDISAPYFLDNCLVMLNGGDHFARRRVVSHLFSSKALTTYKTEKLVPMVERALAELRDTPGDGPITADLVPMTWDMLGRIGATVTGLDVGTDHADVTRLLTYIDAFAKALTVEWSTMAREPILQAGLDARDRLVEDFFTRSEQRRIELVERFRRGEITREELPTDLITLLHLHWSDDWDPQLPLRETTLFLVGSTATTGQAVPLFIMQLERWFADHPEDRGLVFEDPQFLRHAAFESLRLFVAAPARVRRCTEDVTLKSGRHVAAGERVALLFRPANTDADLFGDDASTFNPHRTVENRAKWGLSFGGGEHACLGRPLVTGIHNSHDQADGTMVIITRMLYEAGLRLDPDRVAVEDDSTYYEMYKSLPVLFDRSSK